MLRWWWKQINNFIKRTQKRLILDLPSSVSTLRPYWSLKKLLKYWDQFFIFKTICHRINWDLHIHLRYLLGVKTIITNHNMINIIINQWWTLQFWWGSGSKIIHNYTWGKYKLKTFFRIYIKKSILWFTKDLHFIS